MTANELTEACDKFCNYLQAHGLRPVALVIQVCDDHQNKEHIFTRGHQEVVSDTCLSVICGHRGFVLALA